MILLILFVLALSARAEFILIYFCPPRPVYDARRRDTCPAHNYKIVAYSESVPDHWSIPVVDIWRVTGPLVEWAEPSVTYNRLYKYFDVYLRIERMTEAEGPVCLNLA